jgi:GxxExxY protein
MPSFSNPPISPIAPRLTPDVQTYAIIGAGQEGHRQLGCGFLEKVHQGSLAAEFRRRQIPYRREVEFPVRYKGEDIDCLYRVDFVCYGEVLVELKALSRMSGTEESQVLTI